MPSAPPGRAPWTLVLPVQRAGRAKSRLVVAPGVDHERLARALAADALDAVRACTLVGRRVVVTSDPVVGPAARDAGDDVVPDEGRGLTAAVAAGVARAAALGAGGPVGVLLVDLPALRAQDLTTALLAAGLHRSAFVPDAEGLGTVLLAARSAGDLHPAFGDGSAARHAALGAVRLDLDLPRLRRDVDTAAALVAAAALGLGRRTAEALGAGEGPGGTGDRPHPTPCAASAR